MALTLPADAGWRHRPGTDALVAALGDGAARFVGGAVRDTLLGIEVADVDLATIHPPDQVVARLTAAGIKAVPTGIAHGTITAVSAGTVFEVTTLRHDVETDGRHARVAFTDDWQADAARRDFTINALYADPADGRVHDWFGGLGDLAARRVRFIGDPYRRIAEDHLRILRYFRFHARFGDALDEAGLDACTARANDLMALSRERIAGELTRLLALPAAPQTIALMVDRGIWRPVLPEIDRTGVERLARLAAAEQRAGIAASAVRRLAALLPPDAADPVGARLKLSRADRKRLVEATGAVGDAGPLALGYRVGVEGAIDRLLLAGEDPAPLVGWVPPRLPLTGGALVARGLSRGPDVARTLRVVEDGWITAGFPDAEHTGRIADAAVAQALRDTSNA